jgi:hypothetical protein
MIARFSSRRPWFVAGAGLTVSLVSFFLADAAQPRPEPEPKVSSLFFIAREQPALLPAQQARVDKDEYEAFRQGQAALIRSRFVLDAALRNPKVAELKLVKQKTDPLAWLEKEIVVDLPKGTPLLRIGMTGPEPAQLVEIVKAVGQVYLREIIDRENNKKLDRLERLTRLHAKWDEKRQAKRQALHDVRRALTDPPTKMSEEEIPEIKRELRRLRLAQAGEKARLELYAKVPAKAEKIREELVVLAAQEKLIREDLATLEEQWKSRSSSALDLESVRDDIARWEAYMRKLVVEIERLEIEAHAPARVTLLEEAVVRKGE